ncbi:MAG: rhomboid family intramembrane serine protease [Dysgonomonas sp.]
MNSITLIIIVVTSIVSFIGFGNEEIMDRFKFNVGAVLHKKQWDRLLTSALLHGDMMHLLFNMMTLYFFSDFVISYVGTRSYLLIYIVSIFFGSLLSLWMHRKHSYYSAIGASGGVTGVLFASIALDPNIGIYFFFIPIPIPGFIFGILYLAYSIYGMKKQLGNIGHDAHLGGAVVGLLLAILMDPETLQYNALYIGIMFIPIIVLAYFVYKERNN